MSVKAVKSTRIRCSATRGIRLAVVQHGDYAEALQILAHDLPEPYYGMKRSVALLERMLHTVDYRLISVDAPRYVLERDHGEVHGLERPDWPRLSKVPWSWSVYRAVREFQPTHLLVRTGGILALPALEYAVRRRLNTLVVMAGYMEHNGWRNRLVSRRLARALNEPCVWRVANHRRPATASVVAAGVSSEKVVAWDWDFAAIPSPREVPIKRRDPAAPCVVAFAGTLVEGKGIGDLVRAAIRLHEQGTPIRLQICGDGPLLESLRLLAAPLPAGTVEFLGRVGNDRVQGVFRAATIVCVPSRRDRSEGFPLTLSEALAVRTPVVCTDHPVIESTLVDGEGVAMVEAANPSAIAGAIHRLATDPTLYEKLSRSTPDALARLGGDVTFDELLAEWQMIWQPTAVSHTA
jgi:glycosyltransferase involved in cell wall biosynthesis